jgi:hypothetical protein
VRRPAIALALVAAAAGPAGAAPAAEPFTGKFESGWNKVPSLELVLKQQGTALRGGLTLVADHRGARVLTADLEGKTASRTSAHFKWTDAYGNAGVATLWRTGPKAWRLDAIIKRPTNYGRWFEGHYTLTKTADTLEPGQIPGET